jgi:glycosyltransferase involved in cell wall biosynthesis
MKIGIDARFYGSLGKGLGRYTQKLIEHLEKIDQENHYVVFLREGNFNEYEVKNKNFKKVVADYPWYSFSEQFLFPRLLRKHKLDLMHFPHFNVPIFYGRKFIITIHDLILIHFPTVKNTTLNPLFYWMKFLAYKLCIFMAIRNARHIMTVSDFTKKDIINEYKINPGKISVAYEAADNFCFWNNKKDAEVLKKYAIIKPYLLYVGNAYPHKNLEKLIAAFSLINKEKKDLKLVLVGKHDYFYGKIKEVIKRKKIFNVILPGFVFDEELTVIYKNASLYVFPSLYEGFGLPPLEAMSLGVPVLSSDHKCMREVLGDSAFYMNAGSKEEIFKKTIEALDDEEKRAILIEKGYGQAGKFSWEKMTELTLVQYQKQK